MRNLARLGGVSLVLPCVLWIISDGVAVGSNNLTQSSVLPPLCMKLSNIILAVVRWIVVV